MPARSDRSSLRFGENTADLVDGTRDIFIGKRQGALHTGFDARRRQMRFVMAVGKIFGRDAAISRIRRIPLGHRDH
ncbi:MAG: hypothetical protein EXR39_06920 [Betaproteobacteria bacterium]|nr:hypothetical protein [Betaproteobacteria bacterium]